MALKTDKEKLAFLRDFLRELCAKKNRHFTIDARGLADMAKHILTVINCADNIEFECAKSESCPECGCAFGEQHNIRAKSAHICADTNERWQTILAKRPRYVATCKYCGFDFESKQMFKLHIGFFGTNGCKHKA